MQSSMENFLRLFGLMQDGSIISHLYALGNFWLSFFRDFWTWFFTPTSLLDIVDSIFFPWNYVIQQSGADLPIISFSGLLDVFLNFLTLGGVFDGIPSYLFFWEYEFVPFLFLAPVVIIAIIGAKAFKLIWDALPYL